MSAQGMLVVPTVQGTSREAPEEAYQVARAAAVALFTGEFAAVPVGAQAQIPSGLPVFADPVASVTMLELATENRIVFTTVIDPDGPGPEGQRPVTVSVVQEQGRWRFAGFGF